MTQRPGWRVAFVLAALLAGTRAAPAADAAIRLAVVELQTAGGGGELDGMGAGLQSMITTDLAGLSNMTLVERARLRDVVAELKLGRSGAVDVATAARLGKLVGATHLLTGSVAMAGGKTGAKMRIDARLVEVASGRVLLGESIEGQADLFFELEKALVRKLVDAVAIQVTPKELSALARIQTADLQAFRSYGLGLKLFDDRKYPEALKALREATARDADFSMARNTLAEYERLVAGLRREAEALDRQRIAEIEQQRGRELGDEQKVVERLYERAARRGDDARDGRLTALFLLARALDGHSGLALASEGDEFARARATDVLVQRYVAESLAAFPRFPALVNQLDDRGFFWRDAVPKLATFDGDFARLTRQLAGQLADRGVHGKDKGDSGSDRDHLRERSLTVDLDDNVAHLWLDLRGRIELEDRLDGLLARFAPEDPRRYATAVLARAAHRRAVLDLDESTRLIVGLRPLFHDDPSMLRRLAEEAEANGRLKAIIEASAGSATAAVARETAMLWLARKGSSATSHLELLESELAARFKDGAITPRGVAGLTGDRKVDRSAVLIGDHPLWPIEGIGSSWTGPRRDPRRADEMRYFKARSGGAGDQTFALWVLDGVPRRELAARFQLGFGPPPPDLQAARYTAPGSEAGRPVVTFVFGARDVDRRPPSGGGRTAMRALGLRFEPTRVQLVDVTRGAFDDRARARNELPLTFKPLAERPLAAIGASLDVAVEASGKRVKVQIGRDAVELPLADLETGFCGFLIEEAGYVQVRPLATGAGPE
jgi:TolB-like protein